MPKTSSKQGNSPQFLESASVLPATAAVNPTPETTTPKAPEPKPKKEDGSLKSFGKGLVDGGKNCFQWSR